MAEGEVVPVEDFGKDLQRFHQARAGPVEELITVTERDMPAANGTKPDPEREARTRSQHRARAAEVGAALSRAVWAAVVWRDCAEELLADSVVERTTSAVSVVESTASADSLVRLAFASENAFACFLVF